MVGIMTTYDEYLGKINNDTTDNATFVDTEAIKNDVVLTNAQKNVLLKLIVDKNKEFSNESKAHDKVIIDLDYPV